MEEKGTACPNHDVLRSDIVYRELLLATHYCSFRMWEGEHVSNFGELIEFFDKPRTLTLFGVTLLYLVEEERWSQPRVRIGPRESLARESSRERVGETLSHRNRRCSVSTKEVQ
jgi:hypothetical protein